MNKKDLKVVFIGETGVGKSQLGNFILQNEFFKVGDGKSSETEIISEGNIYLDGMSVTIVDTPGLNDTGSKDEEIMNKIVKKFKDDNSIDGIILVYSFRAPRRVQKHRELVNNLIEIFGKDLLEKRLKVIFTNSAVGEERDEIEEKKERQQMNDTKEFLDYMIMEHEMIFLNSKKKFYDRFVKEIIELLNQIYDIKEKYGSINNALIKKKELEFIEKEKQKEKERMEKELKRQKEEYERKQKKQKEESERRQKELERKMKEELAMHQKELERQQKEFERKQKEELERQQKAKRDKLKIELNNISNLISSYQTKCSEITNNIEELKESAKEDRRGIIISSVLAPFSLGIGGGITAGILAYQKNQTEKKINEYEKDLVYYRTEIEKLRAKYETLTLLI